MSAAVATRPSPVATTMQGIAIPAAIVDKDAFRARTRRHSQQEKKISFTLGQNTQDIITLRRSDILSEITLRIVGTLTTTGASVASTAEWPYNLIKNVKLAANGASSLISARGWTLKAREFAKDEGLSDRGTVQTIGNTSRQNGTLSLASEAWGVGSNCTALAVQTNTPVDLTITLPVAEDQFDLGGALFLATSSAELSVEINWAQTADLFTLNGGTVAFSGTLAVLTTKFDIPSENGAIIVPDLSMFHSLVETSTSSLAYGENEPIIVGQGAGKYVLRVLYQHYNAGAPVPMIATNFGLQAWRYGTAETPDQFIDGSAMRVNAERQYNTDLGGLLGYGVHEFAKAGFRDLVDMSTTTDLRIVTNILNAVGGGTLTTPKLWYAVESMYRSGTAS